MSGASTERKLSAAKTRSREARIPYQHPTSEGQRSGPHRGVLFGKRRTWAIVVRRGSFKKNPLSSEFRPVSLEKKGNEVPNSGSLRIL